MPKNMVFHLNKVLIKEGGPRSQGLVTAKEKNRILEASKAKNWIALAHERSKWNHGDAIYIQ